MMIFVNFLDSPGWVHLLYGGCHIEILGTIHYLMQYFHSSIILCSSKCFSCICTRITNCSLGIPKLNIYGQVGEWEIVNNYRLLAIIRGLIIDQEMSGQFPILILLCGVKIYCMFLIPLSTWNLFSSLSWGTAIHMQKLSRYD